MNSRIDAITVERGRRRAPHPCGTAPKMVASGIQLPPAAQLAGLSDPRRICRAG